MSRLKPAKSLPVPDMTDERVDAGSPGAAGIDSIPPPTE